MGEGGGCSNSWYKYVLIKNLVMMNDEKKPFRKQGYKTKVLTEPPPEVLTEFLTLYHHLFIFHSSLLKSRIPQNTKTHFP